jgi:hypothetical protein
MLALHRFDGSARDEESSLFPAFVTISEHHGGIEDRFRELSGDRLSIPGDERELSGESAFLGRKNRERRLKDTRPIAEPFDPRALRGKLVDDHLDVVPSIDGRELE